MISFKQFLKEEGESSGGDAPVGNVTNTSGVSGVASSSGTTSADIAPIDSIVGTSKKVKKRSLHRRIKTDKEVDGILIQR